MKVVFLCGGTGKRMYPLTEDKFLLNFLGISDRPVPRSSILREYIGGSSFHY